MTAGLLMAGVTDVDVLPLADGGEGTLDVLLGAIGGERRAVDTMDARGRAIVAEWGWLTDGTAVVESAGAAGLGQVADDLEAMEASTAGLGRVVAAVIQQRPRRMIITVGGTASTDGGLGLLDEIGWSLRGVETIVACDVRTKFLDAATTFAPQKGATPPQVAQLTSRLEQLAARYAANGRDIRHLPGAGAGGGLAGGLAAIGSKVRSGFDVVAEAVRFEQRLGQVAAVVTGEGRLDLSSLDGKVVGGVLQAAALRKLHRAVIVGETAVSVVKQLTAESVYVGALRTMVDSDQASRDLAASLVERRAAEWATQRLTGTGGRGGSVLRLRRVFSAKVAGKQPR